MPILKSSAKYRGQVGNANPQTWLKKMMYFTDFSGGLNTTQANDTLSDSEFVKLENVDLSERGSLKRRFGHIKYADTPLGNVQGVFFFETQVIMAVSGKLYLISKTAAPTQLTIANMTEFQLDKPVEAVAFKGVLYIATGSGLVQYDGTTASMVVPHIPNAMEYMYLGGNTLFTNPDYHLVDSVGSVLTPQYIKPSVRKAISGQNVTFTTYISKPDGQTAEYRYSWKEANADDSTFQIDPAGWKASNQMTWKWVKLRDVEVRCEVRLVATPTAIEEIRIPLFSVVTTDSTPSPTDGNASTCTKIMEHNGYFILYGDKFAPHTFYTSDIEDPTYFPVYGSMKMDATENQTIQRIIKYRNMLIGFTDTTISAITGDAPTDYTKQILHTDIGCSAPNSPSVMGNYLVFLASDGLYALKSVNFADDRMNLEKIDTPIENQLDYKDKNTIGVFHKGQYHLFQPSSNGRFRFYYEMGIWVKDVSTKLDVSSVVLEDGLMYWTRISNGAMLVEDNNVHSDDGEAFTVTISTKHLEFAEPFNSKKMKNLTILFGNRMGGNSTAVYVTQDGVEKNSPYRGYATIVNGEVKWVDTFESQFSIANNTQFGQWVLGVSTFGANPTYLAQIQLTGKAYRTQVNIVHYTDEPFHLLGFAFQYKTQKP